MMSSANDATHRCKPTNDNLADYRTHVLSRIEGTKISEKPFYHSFIENVFPDDLYDAIRNNMLSFKYSDKVQDRHQDSYAFMNHRYNLHDNTDETIECVRAVFSDITIKQALLKKFYCHPSEEFVEALDIHSEFEYIFVAANHVQNIHIDIPPKVMSFVFYIPEHTVTPFDEERNATVLYDKSLTPNYKARFKANSMCVFVPHFYSYHGFASTIQRDALVMFYIHPAEFKKWRSIRKDARDKPPFTGLLDMIQEQLTRYPLIEYGHDANRFLEERSDCLVNAPQGRVMTDDQGMILPPEQATALREQKPK
ncbi:MAG: hypothetical protein V3U88_08835 [Methylococcales bacterium]